MGGQGRVTRLRSRMGMPLAASVVGLAVAMRKRRRRFASSEGLGSLTVGAVVVKTVLGSHFGW